MFILLATSILMFVPKMVDVNKIHLVDIEMLGLLLQLGEGRESSAALRLAAKIPF